MTVPVDLDPGWDHNPGKARMDKLRQLEKEKALQLKPGMQRALKQGAQAAQQAKQKYLTQLAAIPDEFWSLTGTRLSEEETKSYPHNFSSKIVLY